MTATFVSKQQQRWYDLFDHRQNCIITQRTNTDFTRDKYTTVTAKQWPKYKTNQTQHISKQESSNSYYILLYTSTHQ